MLTQVVAGRVYDYSHCVGEYMGGMEWPGEGFALPIADGRRRGRRRLRAQPRHGEHRLRRPARASERSASASASSTCRPSRAARGT